MADDQCNSIEQPNLIPASDYDLTWKDAKTRGKVVISCQKDGETLHVDEINPTRAKDRSAFVEKLAAIGWDREQVEKRLIAVADECLSTSRSASTTQNMEEIAPNELENLAPHVIDEANDILSNCKSILELAYQDASSVGIVGEEVTVLALYLAGVSRLLPKPLNVIVQGSSSSGKSHVVNSVAELFPDSTKVVAQQITPNALYYLPEGSLKNRIIVAGERSRVEDDERAEATRALREMLSTGFLRKLVTSKDGMGRLATESIFQEGPISFWESTTLGEIFDEDRNRCIVIHTDETEAQTMRILLSLAKGHKRGCIERQHAMQLLLEQKQVEVPYAELIAKWLPAKKVECRRAFGHLLSCIQASALLHQRQRQSTEAGIILANESDYATAYAIMSKPMSEAIGQGVSDVAADFWGWINTNFASTEFSVTDLLNREDCPKGKDRTYAIVAELQASKCLKIVPSAGKAKVLRIDRSPGEAECPLPEPAVLFSHTPVSGPDDRNGIETA